MDTSGFHLHRYDCLSDTLVGHLSEKKYLKQDGQENNGNQIIMPQWACSVCSCEKLGFLCSVAENMPAESLGEKGVPEITHISPGP